jgi:large subunit ribosomal protein L29
MPSKKYLELQSYDDDQLAEELAHAIAQYEKMQYDHQVVGLENPLRLREGRRDVARLQSEVRRRQLANASPEELAKRDRIRARRRKTSKK